MMLHFRISMLLVGFTLGVSLITPRGFCQSSKPGYTPIPTTKPHELVQVVPISDELRRDYGLNPFWTKCAVIHGVVIIASEKVSDYALLECAWTLDHLLSGRTMAVEALVRSKVRVGVIGATQFTMDIPENQRPQMLERAAYNDRRSRGLGGLPMTTCAEENLLNLRGDPYTRENITIHEFSHTLASAIRRVDRAWYERLREAYSQAKAKGDYGRSYAMTNEQEYWAEGAQCWFDCANPRNSGGASTRDELKAKDPALAALLTEVYGDGPWRYVKTMNRPPEEVAHLAGMDRASLPEFSFNNSPRIRAAATNPALAEARRQRPTTDEAATTPVAAPPTTQERN
jgi:alpha-glucosidase